MPRSSKNFCMSSTTASRLKAESFHGHKSLSIDMDDKVSRAASFIKSLIKSEASLQVITSYVMEQSLFQVRGKLPAKFWVESTMKEIIRVLLTYTADAIEKGNFKNYLNSQENVITQLREITPGNVVNDVSRLAVEFFKGLIKSEEPLQVITSYVVKQSLFPLLGQHPAFFLVMKEIIRVLFTFIADSIEKGTLTNYLNQQENIIPQLSEITRGNIVKRLRKLAKL